MKTIEKLKLYIVKFYDNNIMKPKVYLFDSLVEDENYQLIIIITYDKYTNSANDGIKKPKLEKEIYFSN